MAFLGQEEQIREFQDRFKYLYAVVFLGFGLLVSRLVYLQVLKGDQMRQYSEENRIKRVKVAAPRGMIFDRNHQLLIDNRPDFDLEIIPQYLRESRQEKKVIGMVAKILNISPSEIQDLLDKAKGQPSFMPVKIKTDLTRDEVAQIEVRKIDMPGVEVKEEIKRTHIFGDIAAHLLGYIGEVNSTELPVLNQRGNRYRLGDSIGRFGLEQRMEKHLRGVDGEEIKEVDALGRVKLERKTNQVLKLAQGRPAVPGKNLTLTIDQDLQQVATEAFSDKIGSLVAVDPRNGEILAMLSRPSFDPTVFSRGIPLTLWNKLLNNENHPLRDKTLQDHYSPGSTFKVVTAITGLEEGVIDENTKFHCPGKIKIGNRLYHCHSRHGDINVVRAITQSCDVFFYRVALKLKSVDDIAKWATILGLGKKTGINLAGEVPGLIPTEEWKRKRFNQVWNTGETATVAIGQSFVLTTTLQLANMYAALANGGTLYQPFIVKSIDSYDGTTIKAFQPEKLSEVVLKQKTVDLVKQGLWGVINSPLGTGFRQRLPGMDFVGKTGTVQVIRLSADKIYQRCETMKFKDRHNAIFVGFAPAKNPAIAVAIVAEHACHGGSSAAPIAKAVIKKYLSKYYPELYGEKVLGAHPKSPETYPGTYPGIGDSPPGSQSGSLEDEGYSEGDDGDGVMAPNSDLAPSPDQPSTDQPWNDEGSPPGTSTGTTIHPGNLPDSD